MQFAKTGAADYQRENSWKIKDISEFNNYEATAVPSTELQRN